MLRPLHKSTDHQPTTSAKPSSAARSLAKPTLSVTTDTTIHATGSTDGAESELRVRSRLIERRAAIDHEIENGLHASHLIADGSAPPRSRVLADTAIAHPIGVEADSQAGGHRPWQVIALGYHDQVGYSENRTRSDA